MKGVKNSTYTHARLQFMPQFMIQLELSCTCEGRKTCMFTHTRTCNIPIVNSHVLCKYTVQYSQYCTVYTCGRIKNIQIITPECEESTHAQFITYNIQLSLEHVTVSLFHHILYSMIHVFLICSWKVWWIPPFHDTVHVPVPVHVMVHIQDSTIFDTCFPLLFM